MALNVYISKLNQGCKMYSGKCALAFMPCGLQSPSISTDGSDRQLVKGCEGNYLNRKVAGCGP